MAHYERIICFGVFAVREIFFANLSFGIFCGHIYEKMAVLCLEKRHFQPVFFAKAREGEIGGIICEKIQKILCLIFRTLRVSRFLKVRLLHFVRADICENFLRGYLAALYFSELKAHRLA